MREHEIKLKQQRDSLQQILNTLRQLDAEILDLVAEEEIEGEIERADLLEKMFSWLLLCRQRVCVQM